MGITTILELVQAQPADRPAIGGIGRAPISYGELAGLIIRTVRDLRQVGIANGDRICVVLRNGPELATAFLSIAAGASIAPLNPAFREDEFETYLSDLAVKAIVVEQGDRSAAAVVATRRNIPVLEIAIDPRQPAGYFQLLNTERLHGAHGDTGVSKSADEVLALHTSGTTSRPKVVSLTAQNLLHAVDSVQAILQLRPDDVGLNIMPLFHVHGLVASLLVSIRAGAQVVCAPAFDALKFYRWFAEANPTWYTAVPTIHQAVLARASHNQTAVEATRLRFIRSCSAALPPTVAVRLETLFKCPVIEAYGMTEAAHQIASNPLPPMRRKIGTVGLPVGTEVAILDDQLNATGRNQSGHIVIRGTNVFSGYANNPKANATSFTDGWFRTGDIGFIDDDGYLTVTGREREIIIRGGEKIALREIDDVLYAHPAVDQAAAFSIPHAVLGEEIGALVVLRNGSYADEYEIKDFIAARLAKFKIPRRVIFGDHIPKGATGKLQRSDLAKKLGLI
jgi:acyl-CoA synthetase (AMP-forming)/AMP-acid ligase II